MNVNTSLVTDTSRAVTETSVDAYRDQIAKHIDNDLSAHPSVQLHLVPYHELGGSSSQLAANAALRVLLTDNGGNSQAYALPAIVQAGTFPPAGSAPIILRQPVNLTVKVGGLATFSVYVASSTPGSYQWQKNGSNISGANSADYTIQSAQLSDVGSYGVIVTNAVGAVTSASVTLSVSTV